MPRIGKVTEREGQDFASTYWYHAKCFPIPKKRVADASEWFSEVYEEYGGDEESRGAFLDGVLKSAAAIQEKKSAGNVLSERKRRLLDAAGASAGGAKKKSRRSKGSRKHEIQIEDTKVSSSSASSSEVITEQTLFVRYNSMNTSKLKEVLKWNRQLLSGRKDQLVFRCIDGHLLGAIPICPLCSDKHSQNSTTLKESDDGTFRCGGYYDGGRISCSYKVPKEDLQRVPWVVDKSESREIKKEDEEKPTKMEAPNLELPSGINPREAADRIVSAARVANILLPEAESDARQECGLLYIRERSHDGSADGGVILGALALKFGTKASVEKKKALAAQSCEVPENAPIAAAFDELADLTRKSGAAAFKTNAYKKVARAIRGLTYKITDGKALAKKKTKVEGVGKASADKIQEFLDTGKISKIEELRQKVM